MPPVAAKLFTAINTDNDQFKVAYEQRLAG